MNKAIASKETGENNEFHFLISINGHCIGKLFQSNYLLFRENSKSNLIHTQTLKVSNTRIFNELMISMK